MTAPLTGFYRGYHAGSGKRAGQVQRLHIYRGRVGKGINQTEQAFCGIHAWNVTNSPRVTIDPLPLTPPEGLTWCPRCVGLAAERTGCLATLAAVLAVGASYVETA